MRRGYFAAVIPAAVAAATLANVGIRIVHPNESVQSCEVEVLPIRFVVRFFSFGFALRAGFSRAQRIAQPQVGLDVVE